MSKKYELWRSGDDGNPVKMMDFDDKDSIDTKTIAEGWQKHYESKGHKQLYWLEEVNPNCTVFIHPNQQCIHSVQYAVIFNVLGSRATILVCSEHVNPLVENSLDFEYIPYKEYLNANKDNS